MNDYSDRYSALSDSRLIELMHEGGLTEEAYEALKTEIEKRKIQDVETHQFIAPNNDLYGEKAEEENVKSGLRGWLILFSIGLAWAPIRLIVEIIDHVEFIKSGEYDVAISYLPVLSYIHWYELVGYFINFGLVAVASFYYFKKRAQAPRIIQIYLIFSIVFTAIDILWSGSAFPPVIMQKLRPLIYKAGVYMFVSAVWILYFKQSKRVQNTFVN